MNHISQNHPEVQALSEDLPETSASYIRDRLSFVTLPEEVQDMVGDEDLTVRTARSLARLSIPDPEEREQSIMSIVDALPDTMTDSDYDDLKESIEAEEQDYRERKELAQEAVEEYSELVDKRRNALHEAIDEAGDRLDEDPERPDDIDDLAEIADELSDRLEKEAGELRRQVNSIADDQDDIDVRVERTTKAVMNYDHDHDSCGYCGSEVAQEALQERKESLQEEREQLGDKRTSLSKRASKCEDARRSLRMARRGILTARDEYTNALERAEEANAN